MLTSRKAALVWADRGEHALNPPWATTDWGYLRLHHGRQGLGILHSWVTTLGQAAIPIV